MTTLNEQSSFPVVLVDDANMVAVSYNVDRTDIPNAIKCDQVVAGFHASEL